MLATADQLVAALSLSRSETKHAAWVALADIVAPLADRLVKKYVGHDVEQATRTEYLPLISTRPSLSQGVVDEDDVLAYEGSPQGARPIRQGRGNSRDTLMLDLLPVRSITSVNEYPAAWLNPDYPAGDWPAASALAAGRDWHADWDGTDSAGVRWCKSGFLFRVGGIWSLQARSVRVIYVGGYSADELADTYSEFRTAALITGMKLFAEFKALSPAAKMGNTGIKVAESMDDYSVTYAPPGRLPSILMEDLPGGAKMLLEGHRRMGQFI